MKNVLTLFGFFVFLGFGRLLELIKENILSGFASRMDRLFIKGTDLRRDSTKNLYFCQTKVRIKSDKQKNVAKLLADRRFRKMA